jgi:phage terminase small subunit
MEEGKMAGVKGRSGGPRANSGGMRKNAGRKPIASLKAETSIAVTLAKYRDPKPFLLDIMNDLNQDYRLRVDAAKALLPFTHRKLGETGKKEDKNERAGKASKGKFHAGLPPKITPIR